MKGRIVGNISNLYIVEIKNKKYKAMARGKFKKENIQPVVGDFVEIEKISEDEAVIENICKRDVYIKRPKMSNITQIILVVSSKNPKPDLLMLDKQIIFAELLKIKVIIVLNKIDLDNKNDFKQIKDTYTKIGYKVIETEAKDGIGIENLMKGLNGNINAFSGNSGVGKSTLINAIFKNQIAVEGEISKKNKKGKNTTTDVNLYKINDKTYIADTPGFSTFSIEEIESNKLENYFMDFKKYIHKCEFVGCTHLKEEKCGIKKAMEDGKIDIGRYERFCKIYNELKQKEERKW